VNERNDLIHYRRSRAKETLDDARILIGSKRFSSAVNRIYYALFYEVTALLLSKGLSSAKHSGIKALFNEHFVRPKLISNETGKFFSVMFDFRQMSDYGDFINFEEEKVAEWLNNAGHCIDEIEVLIEKDK